MLNDAVKRVRYDYDIRTYLGLGLGYDERTTFFSAGYSRKMVVVLGFRHTSGTFPFVFYIQLSSGWRAGSTHGI